MQPEITQGMKDFAFFYYFYIAILGLLEFIGYIVTMFAG